MVSLVFTCEWIDRALLNVALEPIKIDLGLSDTQVGAVASASYWVATLSVLPIGRFADHSSRRDVIACALCICAPPRPPTPRPQSHSECRGAGHGAHRLRPDLYLRLPRPHGRRPRHRRGLPGVRGLHRRLLRGGGAGRFPQVAAIVTDLTESRRLRVERAGPTGSSAGPSCKAISSALSVRPAPHIWLASHQRALALLEIGCKWLGAGSGRQGAAG